MDGWTDKEWTDGQTEIRMDKWMNGQMNEYMNGMNRQIDGQVDILMDGWMHGQIDMERDGWTDRQTYVTLDHKTSQKGQLKLRFIHHLKAE